MPQRSNDRRVPDQVRRCVAAVGERPGMDADRAFAICVATMQRAGRLKPGTMTLTPSGAAHERLARERPGFKARMREYRAELTHRNDAPGVAAMIDEDSRRRYLWAAAQGELPDGPDSDPESAAGLIVRALAAGAMAPLEYKGHGIEGAVFCDRKGRAFKVGLRLLNRGRPSLEAEAEWVRVASQVPWVQDHVARFIRWDPNVNVLVRECIDGVKPRWNFDPWAVHREIGERMRPYGFMLPEFKADSYALVRGRGPVLLDAGFAVRVGPRVAREALQKIADSDRVDRGIDARYLRSEAAGWSRPELAHRVASRLDTGRNDAPTAVEWARASWTDPTWGSWGVRIGGVVQESPRRRSAQLYFYRDGWQRDGHGTWGVLGGTLWGLSETPLPVRRGLEEALARVPTVRAAFSAALEEILSNAFRGDEGDLDIRHLPPDTRMAIEAVRAARCAEERAASHRPGTAVREKAEAKAREYAAVAHGMFRQVCGAQPTTGECAAAIAVLKHARLDDCGADGNLPKCSRMLTPELALALTIESPVGPYDTFEPHRVGEHPCCIYHPSMQERVKLHDRVREAVESRKGSDRDVWAAIRAAEAQHPSHDAWERCDAMVRARATGEDFAGLGGTTGLHELVALHDALEAEDEIAALPLVAKYRDRFVDQDGGLPEAGDTGLIEAIVEAARDSGTVADLVLADTIAAKHHANAGRLLDEIRRAAIKSSNSGDITRARAHFARRGVRWESTAKRAPSAGARR